MEADAEQKCESFLQQALQLDPTDSEAYQTLASVRMSQQRDEEAAKILHQSWNIWRTADQGELMLRSHTASADTPPDSLLLPPFHSRVSLAKLFIETKQFLPSLEVLCQLEDQDDEEVQVQYLLGLTWFLLAQARSSGSEIPPLNTFAENAMGSFENAQECGEESRDYLLNCLYVGAVALVSLDCILNVCTALRKD